MQTHYLAGAGTLPGVTQLASDKVQTKTSVSSFPVRCSFHLLNGFQIARFPAPSCKTLSLAPERQALWTGANSSGSSRRGCTREAGGWATLQVHFIHFNETK